MMDIGKALTLHPSPGVPQSSHREKVQLLVEPSSTLVQQWCQPGLPFRFAQPDPGMKMLPAWPTVPWSHAHGQASIPFGQCSVKLTSISSDVRTWPWPLNILVSLWVHAFSFWVLIWVELCPKTGKSPNPQYLRVWAHLEIGQGKYNY